MRLIRSLVLALAGGTLCAGGAAAAERFYLGLHGGLNLVHNQLVLDEVDKITVWPVAEARYEPGYTFGGVVGLRAAGFLRLELEATYRRNGFDEIKWSDSDFKQGLFETDGDVTSLTVIGNVLFDIPTDGPLVATLGLGWGVAAVSFDRVTDADGRLFDDRLIGPAFQTNIGLGYKLTDHLTMSLQYRYTTVWLFQFMTPDQPALGGDDVNIGYSTSAIRLALRYGF